ncbi:OLC1v1023039C4 [Oldenlandia corymbosa var. corymbosa]|uniref:OLC1v1023039C4 n=1 Tax=Oldenlandia corymbosa var. corymbosa TaxID=529605 RepID=A0AAV1C1U2_OLDCO|nr:OLC1v1023039C4 [Oldenlandia corymbosa var. corymbosa]
MASENPNQATRPMRPVQPPMHVSASVKPPTSGGPQEQPDSNSFTPAPSSCSQYTVGQIHPGSRPILQGRGESVPPQPLFGAPQTATTVSSSSSKLTPLVGQIHPRFRPVLLGRGESMPPQPLSGAPQTATTMLSSCSQPTPLVGQIHPSFRPVMLGRGECMPPQSSSGAPQTATPERPRLPYFDKVPPQSLCSVPPTTFPVQPQPPFIVQVPPPWFSSVDQRFFKPSVRQPQSTDISSEKTLSRWSSLVSSCSSMLQKLKSSSPPMESTYNPLAPRQPNFSSFSGMEGCAFKHSEPTALPAPFFPYQAGFTSPRSTAPAPFPNMQNRYLPPLPIPAYPSSYSRNKIQQTDSLPPIGAAVDGMVEDFNALSVMSAPGSNNHGIDIGALPRPLEGDVEPTSLAELYPMNCKSRYLRLTTYAMPNSHDLASRWHFPLGAVICPLSEAPHEEAAIVQLLTTSILCCKICGAYMNPYITFMDGGRQWQCNMCASLNYVPETNGKRMDMAERPELINGSVEYIAAQDCTSQSKKPVYFFLIDVSQNANKSGMLGVIADIIRSCLDKLASFPGSQIGFITFDSKIHFYDMTSSFNQPHMLVVSDVEDVFLPSPSGLLVNLSKSRAQVDMFLDALPSMFQNTSEVESAFGPAVKAADMVMGEMGGKLLIFENTLPSLGAGRLLLRHHYHGADKEHEIRLPGAAFYFEMASELVKHRIAVDVFVFSDKYGDIASLGALSSCTGGQVYHYPNFTAEHDKEKLRYELGRDLMRETAWEALMCIRCGRGLRVASIHGNWMFGSTDGSSLPALDCDKAYTALFCLEETLQTPITYFQVSVAYTSSSGEKRVRVHTAAVPVVTELRQMYRHADTGAIISVYSRLAIEKTLCDKLEDARNFLQQPIVKALRDYQSFIPLQNRQGGQMFYPESLKYLPLYGLSLCKSEALQGGSDGHIDECCAQANAMMTLPVKRLLKLLYPSLIRIDGYLMNASPMVDEFKKTCKRLPLSAESLDSRGLYIYDDGFRFLICFGKTLSPEIATNLLGKGSAADFKKVSLFEQDNNMARKLLLILETLRKENPSDQLPYLVREMQQPAMHSFPGANLIEDPAVHGCGYAEWMLKIFQHIQ